MYSYTWDEETGGLLLNTTPLEFSKEPRPVYYRELDLLGFDKHWNYPKNDDAPIMWAEHTKYFYRGRLVAQTKGGSLYHAPEIILLEEPEPNGGVLKPVDIDAMVEKNRELLGFLTQETIKKVYNTYIKYRKKVDVFYVAFSGGKDSVVTLDIVQRALPHNEFKVLFGDTKMEFPDTYKTVDKIEQLCKDMDVDFLRATSEFDPDYTWSKFGPPANTIRWCCTVHKTTPQIRLLQKKLSAAKFTGMAFTGVRGDESSNRSEYDSINFGEKHSGQYSYHAILDWNSAELFLYIYENRLVLGESYKKGNSRAGCIICPMSSGKHEFFKASWYPNEVDFFVKKIEETSGKHFSQKDMRAFIDNENWKSRRSGRELGFGFDKHVFQDIDNTFSVQINGTLNKDWEEWCKTVGVLVKDSQSLYHLTFKEKTYELQVVSNNNLSSITVLNYNRSRDDMEFISLFKSVMIKSLYCVFCGACVAECSFGCINMEGRLKISDDCRHCHKCHDIHEHCVRYNSIRNKIGADSKMTKGLGRYFSFGIQGEWLDIYLQYQGEIKFWENDGNGKVHNKKKDAFSNFLKDAGIVYTNKKIVGDKYAKLELTSFGKTILTLDEKVKMWAFLLCNLVYSADFNWFIKNIHFNETIDPKQMEIMLNEAMPNDTKGCGKRNVIDAFKSILITSPLGADIGLGKCEYKKRNEFITLVSITRTPWKDPDPLVILYSLYRFAEACDGFYQFTLSRLLNHEIESAGVSPTEIFGLNEDEMKKILTGLSVNYPEFISVSFTLDLDNINLRSDKTSADVLDLI